MRMSWRSCLLILLVGIGPHFGCHQLPGDKAVQDLRPIQQVAGSAKKQDLSLNAAEITQAAWLTNVDALEKAGKAAEAIALCEKMRDTGDPQATKKLARIYHRLDDRDRAEQEYERILKDNPQDVDALYGLGELSYRRGLWGIADKHFSKVLAVQPDHVYATVNLGMTIAQQGYESAAVDVLKKVVSESEAYCNVAFVLALQGKSRDAIRMYETALKIEPAMVRANAELAKIRQADGAITVSLTTPYRVGRQGSIELETTPRTTIEGSSRLMLSRPTLPPLPEVEMVPNEPKRK